jgi:RNA polymerase sigma factor (sigma-70 family)
MTNERLLSSYRECDDHAAFEALMQTHGPMVLRVCRGILGDAHAADDAFQSTFLVLARQARRVRNPDLLGRWLHGVARRIAIRMRIRSRRGAERLFTLSNTVAERGAMVTPDEDATEHELRRVLHEEVGRLPAPLCAAIVVCYFEDVSLDRAAEMLRCPLGTLKHRLSRARVLLGDRLKRRGMITTSLLMLILLTEKAPAVPAELAQSTRSAAWKEAARSATIPEIKRLACMSAAPVSTSLSLFRTSVAAFAVLLGSIGAVGLVRGIAAVAGGDTSFDFFPLALKSEAKRSSCSSPATASTSKRSLDAFARATTVQETSTTALTTCDHDPALEEECPTPPP